MAPATEGHPVGLPFPARYLALPEILLNQIQTARRVPERLGSFHHGQGTHFGGVVIAPAKAQDASAPKQGRERSFLKTRRRNEQARQPRPGNFHPMDKYYFRCRLVLFPGTPEEHTDNEVSLGAVGHTEGRAAKAVRLKLGRQVRARHTLAVREKIFQVEDKVWRAIRAGRLADLISAI
jgi:hypothetical protein